jgi:hypothetical protein
MTATSTMVNDPGAPGVDPVLLALAAQVARGQCILFLGAGVHAPAPPGSAHAYPAELAPPRGGDLSERLAERSSYGAAFPKQDRRNLQRVSAHHERVLGRPQLVADIREAVSAGRAPSPALRALARLDFPLVITTNYDQLFEQALTPKGFDKCVYDPDDTTVTRDVAGGLPSPTRPFVLKIHGDLDEPASLVVTDDDYIQFVLRMGDKEPLNPVPLGVRFALKTWPTLFIGYSLVDYNLRLLFKTLRWKMDRATFPTSYAVDPMPDQLIMYSLGSASEHRTIFIVQDVWTFVPTLYRLVRGEEMGP